MKCFCSEGLLQCHVSLINAYLLIIHCFLIVRFAWIILHMYYVCSLIVLVQWRKLTVDILLLWYVVSVQYGAHENVHGLVDDILTIEQLKPDTVFWLFFTLIVWIDCVYFLKFCVLSWLDHCHSVFCLHSEKNLLYWWCHPFIFGFLCFVVEQKTVLTFEI